MPQHEGCEMNSSKTEEVDLPAEFLRDRKHRLQAQASDVELRALSAQWFEASCRHGYSYQFDWLGRPIIQYPQDIVAMQEVIWRVQPDLIIECGVAHGGSLVLYASILALIDYCNVPPAEFDKAGFLDSDSMVIGIDIEIIPHNRKAILAHPLSNKITLIEGSSTDVEVVEQVRRYAQRAKKVMVCLDSNHSHQHVLAELDAYAPMVSENSYCVVFDTVIEDLQSEYENDRPWNPGDSPKTAVEEYLREDTEFVVDREIDSRLLVGVAPGGYLRKIGSNQFAS